MHSVFFWLGRVMNSKCYVGLLGFFVYRLNHVDHFMSYFINHKTTGFNCFNSCLKFSINVRIRTLRSDIVHVRQSRHFSVVHISITPHFSGHRNAALLSLSSSRLIRGLITGCPEQHIIRLQNKAFLYFFN